MVHIQISRCCSFASSCHCIFPSAFSKYVLSNEFFLKITEFGSKKGDMNKGVPSYYTLFTTPSVIGDAQFNPQSTNQHWRWLQAPWSVVSGFKQLLWFCFSSPLHVIELLRHVTTTLNGWLTSKYNSCYITTTCSLLARLWTHSFALVRIPHR